MKLFTKINKYSLIFIVFLAPAMFAVDYYLIQYFVNIEVNEILRHESERIKFHFEKEGKIPHSNFMFNTSVGNEDSSTQSQFKDTLIYEDYADKLIPYRIYEFTVPDSTKRLKISLRHILLEMNKLILWLFVFTSLILMLLVTGLSFIYQSISKWAWKPFYRNLTKLKNYDITKRDLVRFETSDISEFETLNKVVTTLVNQVEKKIQNLKEFNENISHEMQTPLAIIRNKMVLLLESQSLSEDELQWVQAAYQEVNKLSKIGKSLSLIAKIENQEFSRFDSVDIRAIIDNIIRNMKEIIKFKDLEMSVKLNPVMVKCDPILANILFTNLIKNAIQHNQGRGYIQMVLNEEKFEIDNSGEVLKTETSQLFNRFQKGNSATDTLGLGLAISQKICELYGFRLNYEHHAGKHKFSLLFNI